LKEGGYVAAAGRGLDEASSGRAVLELVRGHVTVTDRAERAQVVDVARAAAVRHRHDVVHVPELTRTHTHTHTHHGRSQNFSTGGAPVLHSLPLPSSLLSPTLPSPSFSLSPIYTIL